MLTFIVTKLKLSDFLYLDHFISDDTDLCYPVIY